MGKLKLMLVTTGLGIGGAEKQVCDLASELSSRGYSVFIVSLTGEREISPKHSDIRIIELKAKKNIGSVVCAIYSLSKLIKEIRPNVIHSHMYHANIISRFSCLLSKSIDKLICTAHSKNEGGSLRMLIYRLTDSFCKITTNVSNEALDYFITTKAFNKKKSRCIHNGMDVHRYVYNEKSRMNIRKELKCNNERVILSVGRLVEAKDHENLLRAFSLLPIEKKVKLVIVGDGERYESLLNLSKKLNVCDRVLFTGRRDDIPEVLSSCDLFILSSKWEGFPLVLAEAMLCRRMVISTNACGASEVIGDNNMIVPVNNSDLLARKIIDMMDLNYEDKINIGNRNREYILNNFSLSCITNEWEMLYKEVHSID